MKSTKFDEHDRRKVITELEEHYGVKLYPVGARRKFLEDGEGKAFWVLGGYEDWHGVPPEMVEEEARRSRGGVLIVAKRYKNKIDVYSGPVRPLIENKDNLSHTKEGRKLAVPYRDFRWPSANQRNTRAESHETRGNAVFFRRKRF